MTEVLFTSDLHLGHEMIAEHRGFKSIEEHDADVINKLNQYCGPRTLLWILGDVAMGEDALALIGNIEGRKKIVRGNHDQEDIKRYLEVFETVHGFLKYKNMWLSHCPIHPQEMLGCDVNVHGHIHKDAITKPLGFPYINVNWDFWSKPLSLYEIRQLRDSQSDGII